MAVKRGRISTLAIDPGSGYLPIGRLLDPALNIETGEIPTTTHDSDEWEESIPGRLSGDIDAPCLLDEADAGQMAAIDAAFAQTVVTIRWRTAGTLGGAYEYESSAWVKTSSEDGPNDEAAKLALSFRITGTVTRVTQ